MIDNTYNNKFSKSNLTTLDSCGCYCYCFCPFGSDRHSAWGNAAEEDMDWKDWGPQE